MCDSARVKQILDDMRENHVSRPWPGSEYRVVDSEGIIRASLDEVLAWAALSPSTEPAEEKPCLCGSYRDCPQHQEGRGA